MISSRRASRYIADNFYLNISVETEYCTFEVGIAVFVQPRLERIVRPIFHSYHLHLVYYDLKFEHLGVKSEMWVY